jgi:luciferase-like monooxygenase
MEDKSSAYDRLKAWILQLPGVTEALHRLGGTEFRVNGVEFMHSHGPSWLDIQLSKEDQSSVLKAGQALRHRAEVHEHAGWVSLRIESLKDLTSAKKVVELAYEYSKKNPQGVKLSEE